MYDLIVIGAGSGGLTAAEFAAQLGTKVALVEKHRVGGDCTWTGCVPSKALLHVAKMAQVIRSADQVGILAQQPAIDMGRVRDYVKSAVHEIYEAETPEVLAAKGIEVILGAGAFVDRQTILVNGRSLTAKKFILATGAHPIIPPLSGLEDVPFWTHEQIFENERLPEHLLVLGAGATGVEVGQAYGRLGAQVTLIDVAGLLPQIDEDGRAVMAQVLAREGVRVMQGRVTAVTQANAQITLQLEEGPTVTGDMLLVAVGRQPTVTGLNLEKAGVAYSKKGVEVNKQLQTTASHIYAVGDCIGGVQATHLAGWQGFTAVRNALLPGSENGVKTAVPLTIFTDPEIAAIGLTEGAAQQHYGAELQITRRQMTQVDRAVVENGRDGFIKILHTAKGKILGATIIAPRAGEMITEFSLAMQHNLTVRDLADTMHSYPSYSMGVQRLVTARATADFLTSTTGKWLRRFVGSK